MTDETHEEHIREDFENHPGAWRPDPENWFREGWLAGYNAAEAEWRARIAAEVLEMGEERHQHHGLAYSVAKKVALRIIRGPR